MRPSPGSSTASSGHTQQGGTRLGRPSCIPSLPEAPPPSTADGDTERTERLQKQLVPLHPIIPPFHTCTHANIWFCFCLRGDRKPVQPPRFLWMLLTKPAPCWGPTELRVPGTYNSRIRHAAKRVDLPEQDSIAPHVRLGGKPLENNSPHQTRGTDTAEGGGL